MKDSSMVHPSTRAEHGSCAWRFDPKGADEEVARKKVAQEQTAQQCALQQVAAKQAHAQAKVAAKQVHAQAKADAKQAHAQAKGQRSMGKVCQSAAKSLRKFRTLGDGQIPEEVLANAKGLAFLTVAKLSCVHSMRGGHGVVVSRLEDGSWSAPCALGIGSVGLGGQIGGELTDFIMVLNDDAAVGVFKKGGNMMLGGNVSCAAGPIGRNGEGAVALGSRGDQNAIASVYSYSRTRGLFAGVSIETTGIVPWQITNRRCYGPCSAKDILEGGIAQPLYAQPLYDEFARYQKCIQLGRTTLSGDSTPVYALSQVSRESMPPTVEVRA